MSTIVIVLLCILFSFIGLAVGFALALYMEIWVLQKNSSNLFRLMIASEKDLRDKNWRLGDPLKINVQNEFNKLLVAAWYDTFKEYDAKNYCELTCNYGDIQLVITVQKKDGMTPDQLKKATEVERDVAIENLNYLRKQIEDKNGK